MFHMRFLLKAMSVNEQCYLLGETANALAVRRAAWIATRDAKVPADANPDAVSIAARAAQRVAEWEVHHDQRACYQAARLVENLDGDYFARTMANVVTAAIGLGRMPLATEMWDELRRVAEERRPEKIEAVYRQYILLAMPAGSFDFKSYEEETHSRLRGDLATFGQMESDPRSLCDSCCLACLNRLAQRTSTCRRFFIPFRMFRRLRCFGRLKLRWKCVRR